MTLKQEKGTFLDCVIHHVTGYLLLMRVQKNNLIFGLKRWLILGFITSLGVLLLCFVKLPDS